MPTVDIYRNLTRNCWSIRDHKSGRVTDHLDELYLERVTFTVRPGGRAKVLETGQKNVHAFATGLIPTLALASMQRACDNIWPHTPLTYNPYKYSTFVVKATEQPIHQAGCVHFRDDGKIEQIF